MIYLFLYSFGIVWRIINYIKSILQARPSNSRSSVISTDTKKRKSEDNSEANSKKPKQQRTTAASKVRY